GASCLRGPVFSYHAPYRPHQSSRQIVHAVLEQSFQWPGPFLRRMEDGLRICLSPSSPSIQRVLRRLDILLHAETLRSIVLAFPCRHPLVIGAVAGPHQRLLPLPEAGEVEVKPTGTEAAHGGPGIARPGDAALAVRRVDPSRVEAEEIRCAAAAEGGRPCR